MYRDFIRETNKIITGKELLKKTEQTKSGMRSILKDCQWDKAIQDLISREDYTAGALLEAVAPVMDRLCDRPQEGWLENIYNETIAYMYPENFVSNNIKEQERGRAFFLENYRAILELEKKKNGFSPVDNIELLEDEQIKGCVSIDEYKTFRRFWRTHYIYEFMRIARELTSFNTVGHVGGVHHIVTFVGGQMSGTDVPIDIALASAAAAGHDIGKYGCSREETSRIPYLHYYYTRELLMREEVPLIAHIAGNHSTWDLELENLSIESLLLIYADFRVKSTWSDGVETVHFYTLDEAFDVILNKLDNVDDVKLQRYRKVYAKLKDFENYMEDIGVVTDVNITLDYNVHRDTRDTVLLMGNEVTERIKYTAIEHNINIMSIFNNEAAFGNLLEAAESERQWKSQRAYLNILMEYHTYMTKQEKTLTVHYLYDLLSNREGDIRRQAGKLMGTILVKYDDVYTKELPGFARDKYRNEGASIWKNYLNKVVFPDYRTTDQHRRWIGHSLKVIMQGILENGDKNNTELYLEKYFELFRKVKLRDSAVFIILDSIISIPAEFFNGENVMETLIFIEKVSMRESLEIKICALRAADYISGFYDQKDDIREIVMNILFNCQQNIAENVSTRFLAYKILDNMGEKDEAEDYFKKLMFLPEEDISNIFRENLKVGTPWITKIVNIDFLLEFGFKTNLMNRVFHMATHFSNLLKVSERVTVRHRAGEGLIIIGSKLPIEQLNEIVIELTKGLEIGEYQFSKYIPEYLGQLALFLPPSELEEFISTISRLIENSNNKIGSVALDTIGEVMKRYATYKFKDCEVLHDYQNRQMRLMGMLIKGLANYNEIVSQEALMVIGQYIFGYDGLTLEQKFEVFRLIDKKMLTLINSIEEYDMNFFTNAAALNHIYRFISEYTFEYGEMKLHENKNIAFFPGTFDPFSSSHKGIVKSIIDEGFDVYLAIDEFSWSKKTQPRMIRRQLMTMSVADEMNVFVFPDDIPVNIANPKDLRFLKSLFPNRNFYIVVGSDVVANASSYKVEATEDSIHNLNHIVFKRETIELRDSKKKQKIDVGYDMILGDVRELTLPVYLEDISSTRIRENIDYGRDISNLIDPVAQNYIYDNSLYLREPQYKNVLEIKKISFESIAYRGSGLLNDMRAALTQKGIDVNRIREYIEKPYVSTATVKNHDNRVCSFVAVNLLETRDLYDEFQDAEIAEYLRRKATGRMLIIRGVYCDTDSDMRNMIQLIITEVLAEALKNDITYALYHPLEKKDNFSIIDTLQRQGFTEIKMSGNRTGIYEVNMKEPIAVIENMDTVLKSPFNTNDRIIDVLESSHRNMQRALTRLYPGNLVMSFNAGIINHKIVNMVTQTNNVPNYPLGNRKLGEYMCVPFGKIMKGIAVPNTVTKTLHTEKMFSPKLDRFSIEEYPMYANINNQIKTIKSFNRPVILVDDLLHKGYRIKALDPIFKENDVEIKKLITGLLSGRGKDLMSIRGREVESAYFIPNMKYWFVESSLCPFIGGDGVRSKEKNEANLISSINLLLPFASPAFIKNPEKNTVYDFSVTCLENALKIFQALEAEYQKVFERKLTITRLSDAIQSPRMPNGSNRVAVDYSLSPSVYMEDYMERLVRLKGSLE